MTGFFLACAAPQGTAAQQQQTRGFVLAVQQPVQRRQRTAGVAAVGKGHDQIAQQGRIVGRHLHRNQQHHQRPLGLAAAPVQLTHALEQFDAVLFIPGHQASTSERCCSRARRMSISSRISSSARDLISGSASRLGRMLSSTYSRISSERVLPNNSALISVVLLNCSTSPRWARRARISRLLRTASKDLAACRETTGLTPSMGAVRSPLGMIGRGSTLMPASPRTVSANSFANTVFQCLYRVNVNRSSPWARITSLFSIFSSTQL